MLYFHYVPGWHANVMLSYQALCEKKNSCRLLTYHNLALTTPPPLLQQSGTLEILLMATGLTSQEETTQWVRQLIERISHRFARSRCLAGLFRYASLLQNWPTPFIATEHFHLKVYTITQSGSILCNISPIYAIGPTSERTRTPHAIHPHKQPLTNTQPTSRANDLSAITPLPLSKSSACTPPTPRVHSAQPSPQTNAIIDLDAKLPPILRHKTQRQLGIDTGMLFQNNTIPYNQILKIELQILNEGIFAKLTWDNIATSQQFNWQMLGITHLTQAI